MKLKNVKILSLLLAIVLTISFVMPTHILASEQDVPENYVPQNNTSDIETPTVYKEAKDPVILQQVYSKVAPDGVVFYDYGTIILGDPHSVVPTLSVIPNDATFIATAHTHPMGEGFSPTDIQNANQRGKDSYVGDTSMKVKKYSFNTGKVTHGNNITPTPLTEQQKTALVAEFRASWYYHVDSYKTQKCPYGFDCKNYIWPTS